MNSFELVTLFYKQLESLYVIILDIEGIKV